LWQQQPKSTTATPYHGDNAMSNGSFTMKRVRIKQKVTWRRSERTIRYSTWRVQGWLLGQRVRQNFRNRLEALGALQRLEIQAANDPTHIRPINTRLTAEQVVDAEAALHRLAGRSLTQAVDWFLETYRPPVSPMDLAAASTAFQAARAPHLSAPMARDYKRVLADLCRDFPGRQVHEITTEELQANVAARKVGPKSSNNLRVLWHAFWNFCQAEPRRWCETNPAKHLPQFKVARGIPAILTAAKVAELMAYLETYAGGARSKHKPGFLLPTFALCTFAGIRPSIPGGELHKLGLLPAAALAKVIDLENGVIRIGPSIAKTRDLRQIKIQPALRAWLDRYPLKKYPILVPNLQNLASEVRVKFGLPHDIMRHTFISMHVAKFKSLGAAALEAGNSERIIRRHYLNMVSEAEAERFWGIRPAKTL
jgi:hypothetical protein